MPKLLQLHAWENEADARQQAVITFRDPGGNNPGGWLEGHEIMNAKTLETALRIAALLESPNEATSSAACPCTDRVPFWVTGKTYLVQTVTLYFTGVLKDINEHEAIFDDAAWIPDIGRAAQAFESGSFSETEPFPSGQLVALGRGAIVASTAVKYLSPRSQK